MSNSTAHPPATLEGWYALHQIFRLDRNQARRSRLEAELKSTQVALSKRDGLRRSTVKSHAKVDATRSGGWSCIARLIGSTSDVMVVHFRESLEGIGVAQDVLAKTALARLLEPVYAFLSVTEAGLYHLTADLARQAEARGGAVGDESYVSALAERSSAEATNDRVARRLYPERPANMPYICFYPMSKRRDASQNWYTLGLDERSRLMQAHGLTGRRYAGKVQQVITGAIGLDAWEWGVTLFASDPLEFKKLVTDMRFDEVSAKYAEFGDFYVGKILGT
jgi:hydrogen peroxide-dependent heme synthase